MDLIFTYSVLICAREDLIKIDDETTIKFDGLYRDQLFHYLAILPVCSHVAKYIQIKYWVRGQYISSSSNNIYFELSE